MLESRGAEPGHDGEDTPVPFDKPLPEAVDRVAIREALEKRGAVSTSGWGSIAPLSYQPNGEARGLGTGGKALRESTGSAPEGPEYGPLRRDTDMFPAAVIVESNEHTQPQIAAAIELLQKRFGPAEMASLYLFERVVGRNPFKLRPTYIIATVTDNSGGVVAMASGSVTPTGLLLVEYTASDEKYKGCRLGTKAYKALVVAAEEISKTQFGRSLRLFALEASPGAGEFWKRQGFGEIHLTDQRGEGKKLAYLQPPLNWMRESGEPERPGQYPDRKEIVLEGRRMNFPGVNSELMLKMIDSTDCENLSPDIVLEAIRAFYREYYFTKRAVDSSVHERHFGYFYALMDSYYHDLTSASDISLG